MIAVFIFYNYSSGKQSWMALSKRYRHCNVITFDGMEWVMVEFDLTGLRTRVIHTKDAVNLLDSLHIIPEVVEVIAVSIRKRKRICWKPYWVRSCNEVCRYVSGIDIGFTFNPVHLHHKLLKYQSGRNYELLSYWERTTDGRGR